MDDVKIFMIGIDLLGLLFSVIALINGYKDKDIRYFSPIVNDIYGALEWAVLIFIILLICITIFVR
jgi:hypothetical protein